MQHTIMRATVEVNGTRLFYLDTGPGKPPMLCLHGRWGRAETWTDLIARYAARFRIIAPDQRGHGLSDKPPSGYTAEVMAADGAALLDQVGSGGCEPAVLVGHSMGGRIAAHMAVQAPGKTRALAILDETARRPEHAPGVPPSTAPDDDGLTLDWPARFPTRAAARRFLESRFPRETNVRYFLDSLAETEEGWCFLFSRRAMAAIRQCSRGWIDLLPRIRCPVLLVRAAESWCLSTDDAETMRSSIDRLTYCEVPGSDHMVYADNPEVFYRGLDRFLDGL